MSLAIVLTDIMSVHQLLRILDDCCSMYPTNFLVTLYFTIQTNVGLPIWRMFYLYCLTIVTIVHCLYMKTMVLL